MIWAEWICLRNVPWKDGSANVQHWVTLHVSPLRFVAIFLIFLLLLLVALSRMFIVGLFLFNHLKVQVIQYGFLSHCCSFSIPLRWPEQLQLPFSSRLFQQTNIQVSSLCSTLNQPATWYKPPWDIPQLLETQ